MAKTSAQSSQTPQEEQSLGICIQWAWELGPPRLQQLEHQPYQLGTEVPLPERSGDQPEMPSSYMVLPENKPLLGFWTSQFSACLAFKASSQEFQCCPQDLPWGWRRLHSWALSAAVFVHAWAESGGPVERARAPPAPSPAIPTPHPHLVGSAHLAHACMCVIHTHGFQNQVLFRCGKVPSSAKMHKRVFNFMLLPPAVTSVYAHFRRRNFLFILSSHLLDPLFQPLWGSPAPTEPANMLHEKHTEPWSAPLAPASIRWGQLLTVVNSVNGEGLVGHRRRIQSETGEVSVNKTWRSHEMTLSNCTAQRRADRLGT